MGGMTELQLRLTPADARLLLALLETEYTSRLTAEQLDRAHQLAPYLRHRIVRLWGPRELPEIKPWTAAIESVPAAEWRGINGND